MALIWVMLLALAGRCNAGGTIYITEGVPYTTKGLADELGFDVETLRTALDVFTALNMIKITSKGYINILGWADYQSEDKLAEIRAKDRERKRLKRARLEAESADVHGLSADSPCVEAEEEPNSEVDSESHSLIRSRQEARLSYLGGDLGKGVVMISEDQFDDLLDRLSLDEFKKYVEIIADNELKGHHYKRKTHYQAILDMAHKDRRLELPLKKTESDNKQQI